MKSTFHRWFGPSGSTIGLRVPQSFFGLAQLALLTDRGDGFPETAERRLRLRAVRYDFFDARPLATRSSGSADRSPARAYAAAGHRDAGGVHSTHFQPAEFRLPLVECGGAGPMTAAHLCRRYPRLLLLQYCDNLLFSEPASFHSRPTPLRRTLPKNGRISVKHVTADTHTFEQNLLGRTSLSETRPF